MKRILSIFAILFAAYTSSFGQCDPSFTELFTPSGNSLLNYTFTNTTATTYTPQNGYNVVYSLNYGDGTSNNYFSTYYNAEHNYNAPGVYVAVLTMTAMYNASLVCTSTYSTTVSANYTPCETSASINVITQSSTEETFSFSANNPAGTPGMSYSWTFGDGSTGTGLNPSHTYTVNSGYPVILTATNGTCTYIDTQGVTVGCIYSCGTNTCSASYNINYNTVNFTDNYSNSSNPSQTSSMATWTFGDGGTSSNLNPNHTYSATGIYTVTLTNNWVDSSGNGGQSIICTKYDTTTVSITSLAPPPPDVIFGYIVFDQNTFPANTICKVWLITYDSTTNLLEAIDSTTSLNVNVGIDSSGYSFNNEPDHVYRIKAALINNATPGSSGYIPTYHDTSLYWSNAKTLNYTGGTVGEENIQMQYGTVPSGPGFIAGNVLTGANKMTGTTGGVPAVGMMIYLRNTVNNILTYTYTDVNGNYTFSNIANGTYSIYPEAINYATTPFNSITVNNGQASNINFKQNTTDLTIEPITTGINNVSAATNVSIYPNPTTGNISVSWQQATKQTVHIAVTDAIGREVYNTNITMNAGNGSSKLNLSQLQNGIYTVQLRSADINYIQKLVVEK